jgi:hypothetical protein
LVDDHEQAHTGSVGGRGNLLQRRRLVGVGRVLAGLPDAGDRERVEAGPGQLVHEGGRVARSGGVVDDADGELVPVRAAAAGEEESQYEEGPGTNGAVLTVHRRLKPAIAFE